LACITHPKGVPEDSQGQRPWIWLRIARKRASYGVGCHQKFVPVGAMPLVAT
jgi:hypothetical protein